MTTRGSVDPYYDLIDDFGLIVSSFQTQYGLRLSRELPEMTWDEFKDLLAGIGPETPLGRIVTIRSESDAETLKHFTKEQRKIHDEWLIKRAKSMSKEKMDDIMNQLKDTFIKMAIGGAED